MNDFVPETTEGMKSHNLAGVNPSVSILPKFGQKLVDTRDDMITVLQDFYLDSIGIYLTVCRNPNTIRLICFFQFFL